MKIISDLVAHVESLIASGEKLFSELCKHQSVTQAEIHAPEAVKVQELHAAASATVAEAQAHLASASIPGGTEVTAPRREPPPVDNEHIAEGCTPFPTMRAKMLVTSIRRFDSSGGELVCEVLSFAAVGGDKVQKGYPEDGSDEDNTYAHYSPSGSLEITVANPALFGKIIEGEKYYLDFTRANAAPAIEDPAPEAPAPATQPAGVLPGGSGMPSAAELNATSITLNPTGIGTATSFADSPLTEADFPNGVPTATDPAVSAESPVA